MSRLALVCLSAAAWPPSARANIGSWIGSDGKEHSNLWIAGHHKPDFHLRKPAVHMLNNFVGKGGFPVVLARDLSPATAHVSESDDWGDIKLFRAVQCVQMIRKHGKSFNIHFQPCVEFMHMSCNPDQNNTMETPTGKGYCTTWADEVNKNYGGEGQVQLMVEAGCESHQDTTNCTSVGCDWNGTGCQMTCPMLFVEEACADRAECSWQGKYCITGCDGFEKMPSCAMHYDCSWNANACQATCAAYIDMDGCTGQSECAWNGYECRTACPALQDEYSCTGQSECFWDGSSCQATCSTHVHKASCSKREDCSWVGTRCMASCSSFDVMVTCAEHQECVWGDDDTCKRNEAATLPEQGFQGSSVPHHKDWSSKVVDFRHEYGPNAPGLQSYQEICCKYPNNKWCRTRGYHSSCPKERSNANFASPRLFAVALMVPAALVMGYHI